LYIKILLIYKYKYNRIQILIQLPTEIQSIIFKKYPLKDVTRINKNLYDASRQRWCHNFKITNKQKEKYRSDKPYVFIEKQEASTGSSYNALIINLLYNNDTICGVIP
jgi:hypothetical protein